MRGEQLYQKMPNLIFSSLTKTKKREWPIQTITFALHFVILIYLLHFAQSISCVKYLAIWHDISTFHIASHNIYRYVRACITHDRGCFFFLRWIIRCRCSTRDERLHREMPNNWSLFSRSSFPLISLKIPNWFFSQFANWAIQRNANAQRISLPCHLRQRRRCRHFTIKRQKTEN